MSREHAIAVQLSSFLADLDIVATYGRFARYARVDDAGSGTKLLKLKTADCTWRSFTVTNGWKLDGVPILGVSSDSTVSLVTLVID